MGAAPITGKTVDPGGHLLRSKVSKVRVKRGCPALLLPNAIVRYTLPSVLREAVMRNFARLLAVFALVFPPELNRRFNRHWRRERRSKDHNNLSSSFMSRMEEPPRFWKAS
jgi:hypothetical protein